MNVLMLLIFIGAAVVSLFVVLFLWSVRNDTFGQADRLALLPLMEDARVAPTSEGDASIAPENAEATATGANDSGTNVE